MNRPLSAQDELCFGTHDLRLMVSGCLLLAQDLLEGMLHGHPLTEKTEVVVAMLKATERQARTIFNLSEQVSNGTQAAPAGA